ncbi:uncharacterized protein LOC124916478 [Impatiens glandulifera]|uniref:uncharacterized protein LOC124916478 n=1 Tax=Impatiens glandulifera TaxID=253017 RepID=UPI001FB0CBA5|nr:uncharacterized protein LOC124916478 [Impatiens glandulifera]
MGRHLILVLLILAVLASGFSSTSASTPPAKIVGGIVSNVVSTFVKWLWSLKSSTTKQGLGFSSSSSRSMMKFESGYSVETVFDGSKLGIEPHSVKVSPSGDLLVLDSENSNVYKISTPLSLYSRPKLVAGSPEGYSGHVDGKPREARMNHPKGFTVDDRGNVYIADTLNMAIRKISDSGVVTIAGGIWGRGGHVDGPSEEAKFSEDFDLVYVGSSCSLLVIDRGNQAIRQIQLHEDECSPAHYDNNLHLGIAVLAAAGFFGYMLALLQRRVAAMFSSSNVSDINPYASIGAPVVTNPSYQRPIKSVRPPLIPNEDEYDKQEEGLFGSLGRLVMNAGSSMGEIFAGLFSRSRKKPINHHQHYQQPNRHPNAWPMQETFVIPDEDEPPSLEKRNLTTKRAYPFAAKEMERTTHQFKQGRPIEQQQQQRGWGGSFNNHQQQQQYHQRHYSSGPQTYYEQSCESNEVVFGAVQEQDGRRGAMVIKAVDYARDPRQDNGHVRSRYMGYSYGY